MRRLNCAVQRYEWGKRGNDSRVARLKRSECEDFGVEEEEAYAELWMGTHPNGPSRVAPTEEELAAGDAGPPPNGIFLIELLESHPEVLGELEELGDLPFMFKILSIGKALSIQAHPDKRLAERLYATRPDLYKDDNHKPEMAVALSDFEGLCGFRSFEEIAWNVREYPELRAVAGAAATGVLLCPPGDAVAQRAALCALFRAYITAPTTLVATQIGRLLDRLGSDAAAARRDSNAGSVADAGMAAVAAATAASPAIEWPRLAGGGSGHGGGGGSDRGSEVSVAEGVTDHEELDDDDVGSGGGNGGGGSGDSGSVGADVMATPPTSTGYDDDGWADPPTASPAPAAARILQTPSASLKTRGRFYSAEAVLGQAAESEDGAAAAAAAGTPERTRAATAAGAALAATAAARRKFEARMRRDDGAVRSLMMRLSAEYPGDVGILMPLLLNYLRMRPGEAFFMAANEPHAYLQGDLMEVMARSDNVVRVALTPKHRDVPLLLEILTYNMGPPPVVATARVDECTVRYTPPIADFELEVSEVPSGEEYAWAAMPVPQILLCLSGTGTATDINRSYDMRPGAVLFVPAHMAV
ncbi:unnamed protein product, partial [Phaeothamnion confervicola]